MCFDPIRGVTVIFGGDNGGNETWEWNGIVWSQRTPANVPPARANATLTFDESRGVCVLFGGTLGFTNYNDTWEWNGSDWIERTSMTQPAVRFAHAACYDSARETIVVFGGLGTSMFFNDTWEFDGPSFHITQNPEAQVLAIGEDAQFSIVAQGVGSGGFTYRWRHDGVPIFDGAAYANTASSTLTIHAVDMPQIGAYDCVVSGACGSRLSLAASLEIDECRALDATGDCNGNAVLDDCELAANASLDADANGILDSCEPDPADPCATMNSQGDCNGNHVLDTCEITANPGLDSDGNGELDSCEPPPVDLCKPVGGVGDCNSNGVVDACEIAVNPDLDEDQNGILDTCDKAPGGSNNGGGNNNGNDGDPMMNTAPCGMCGGGAATMLPLTLFGMVRRRPLRTARSLRNRNHP